MQERLETIISTPSGEMRIAVENLHIVYCGWVDRREGNQNGSFTPKVRPTFIASSSHRFESDRDVAIEATRQLMLYFAGELQQFSLPIALRGTPFQCEVWKEIFNIPFGHVATYGELARRMGRPTAARAVANACGANAIAVILPCHRVVGCGRRTGGYRWGAERKTRLLKLENTPPSNIIC